MAILDESDVFHYRLLHICVCILPDSPWYSQSPTSNSNWSISLEVLIENPGIFKEAHIDYISYKLYSTHWKSIFPLQCLLQWWQLWYWYKRRSLLANKCTYILYDTCNYRHIQSNHLPLPLLAKQDQLNLRLNLAKTNDLEKIDARTTCWGRRSRWWKLI